MTHRSQHQSANTRLAVARPAAFYVPVNSQLQPQFEEYDAYFLNLLHWKWLCWQADGRGWIRLKTRYITRVIPRDVWPNLCETLVGQAVIYQSGFFVPGVCSRKYQIAPDHRCTRRLGCSNPVLAARIRSVYDERNHLQPVHRWLRDKLGLITLDCTKAESVLQSLRPDVSSPMPCHQYHTLLREQCKLIADGEMLPTVDRFGRVHTPITSLAKPLRDCLSVDGQGLVNIDLANSQPLIAGILASQFHQDRSAAHRLRRRSFSPGKNPYHKRMPQPAQTDREDLLRYLAVCEQGQLYESFGGDREQVKQQLLTAFYDKARMPLSPLQRQIAERYPSVHAMLTSVKKRDYRHAAHLMQNSEACLFIHGVCRSLMEEHPRVPVVTIHDSVMTTPGYVSLVKSSIEA